MGMGMGRVRETAKAKVRAAVKIASLEVVEEPPRRPRAAEVDLRQSSQ